MGLDHPLAAATAGTVRLAFRARAVHVRTARLVAVTVVRRAGWPDDSVEAVRQAVGEACAIVLRAAAPDDVLTVELDDAAPGLTVWVGPAPDETGSVRDVLPRAVLAGLTDQVSLDQRDGQTVLRLRWDG